MRSREEKMIPEHVIPIKAARLFALQKIGDKVSPESSAYFDSAKAKWIIPLKTDYPRILRDDRTKDELLSF
jgi:hypothetical protein